MLQLWTSFQGLSLLYLWLQRHFPEKGFSPVSQSVSIFERRCYLNLPIFLSWGSFLTFCIAIQLLNIICADCVLVFPLLFIRLVMPKSVRIPKWKTVSAFMAIIKTTAVDFLDKFSIFLFNNCIHGAYYLPGIVLSFFFFYNVSYIDTIVIIMVFNNKYFLIYNNSELLHFLHSLHKLC